MRDVKRVLEDFCRRNGLRMAYVKEEERCGWEQEVTT